MGAFSLMAEDKIRAFLAISFGVFYQKEFERILKTLKSYSDEVKWVDPAQVHLTLHFFGSVELNRIESLKSLIRNLALRFRPFEVYLKGIGAFPNMNRPRILWVGLDGDIQDLKNMKEACDLELIKLGFSIEDREFKAHLTLGRLREGARIQLQLPDLLNNYIFDQKYLIQEIVLYQSNLTPKGPIYTPIEYFKFQA